MRTCVTVAVAIVACLMHATAGEAESVHGMLTVAPDDKGVLTILPQGKRAAADAVKIATDANTTVSLAGEALKVADLKAGTWVQAEIANGVATKIVAGIIVAEDGDKLVLFKGLPEAFFLDAAGFDIKGYPTRFGPLQLMYRLVGKGGAYTGSFLRPGIKGKPTGGYVMYWPPSLKARFFDGHSRPQPDEQGRLFWPGELTEVRTWFVKDAPKPTERP